MSLLAPIMLTGSRCFISRNTKILLCSKADLARRNVSAVLNTLTIIMRISVKGFRLASDVLQG